MVKEGNKAVLAIRKPPSSVQNEFMGGRKDTVCVSGAAFSFLFP